MSNQVWVSRLLSFERLLRTRSPIVGLPTRPGASPVVDGIVHPSAGGGGSDAGAGGAGGGDAGGGDGDGSGSGGDDGRRRRRWRRGRGGGGQAVRIDRAEPTDDDRTLFIVALWVGSKDRY